MTVTDIVIATDHPAFAGHFPGMPIVPGVVLLDEALHAIASLGAVDVAGCVLSSVKFKHVVRPGQAVTLRFEVEREGNVRFELRAAGQQVASGLIVLTRQRPNVHAI